MVPNFNVDDEEEKGKLHNVNLIFHVNITQKYM